MDADNSESKITSINKHSRVNRHDIVQQIMSTTSLVASFRYSIYLKTEYIKATKRRKAAAHFQEQVLRPTLESKKKEFKPLIIILIHER
jgi:hypothetical protein